MSLRYTTQSFKLCRLSASGQRLGPGRQVFSKELVAGQNRSAKRVGTAQRQCVAEETKQSRAKYKVDSSNLNRTQCGLQNTNSRTRPSSHPSHWVSHRQIVTIISPCASLETRCNQGRRHDHESLFVDPNSAEASTNWRTSSLATP